MLTRTQDKRKTNNNSMIALPHTLLHIKTWQCLILTTAQPNLDQSENFLNVCTGSTSS